jgi:transposase InsO family protein
MNVRVKPYLIIRTFKKEKSVLNTAGALGIHPATVYRWIKRARSNRSQSFGLSERNLLRRSTRPHAIHKALSPQDEANIVSVRIKKRYTAEKIKKKLGLSVSILTVHRTLKRYNLIDPNGYHRRPRFQDTIHMHAKNTKTVGYLQMDVKYLTPELTGLPWTCFEYAVIDIYSRYKEVAVINHLDEDGAISALLEMLPKLPFKPIFLQTDNGLEFQGRFRRLLADLRLKHHFIHKRTPNENAVIERSFRTDEEEFLFRLEERPKHYDELRNLFAAWIHEYNYERPHLGIDLKTPYEVVANVLLD